MNGWQAFALALGIWAVAVSLICLWVSAALRKPASKFYGGSYRITGYDDHVGDIDTGPVPFDELPTRWSRRRSLKLYDPQTSEPSFWAAPAADSKIRKRPKR